MTIYLDISQTPPENIFAGNCCVAVVGETQVSPAILSAWSDGELAALNLVRAELQMPTFDPSTQVLGSTYSAAEMNGVWVWSPSVRALTADEIAQRTAADAQLLREEADRDLKKSDLTVLRCFESGIPLPVEWADYRAALRAIISGGPGPIPARPAYPAGT